MIIDRLFKFLKSRDGNVVIMFALCLLPMVLIAGGAVDFSRRLNYETRLQSAADAAILAATRYSFDGDHSAKEVEDFAKAYLINNFDAGKSSLLDPSIKVTEGETLSINATANVPTTLLNVMNLKTLKAHVDAETALGASGIKMEAVLVLDVSYSMTGDRIKALKDASKNFAKTVMEEDNPVKIGVVPFNRYVNVGKDIDPGNWLNKPKKVKHSWNACHVTKQTYTSAGCKKKAYSCTKDGVKKTCHKWDCPPKVKKKDLPKTCTPKSVWAEFQGCVKSRTPELDIQDKKYSSTKVEGFTGTGPCVPEILPLSDKKSDIDKHINSLWVSNDTYIASGISWGMRVLSSQAPFDQGEDYTKFYDERGRKVMIIMSDGANTRSRSSNGYHDGTNVTAANDRTKAACKAAADEKIEVYTIALDVKDKDTLKILENCATQLDQFHAVTFASELKDTFQQIAKSLQEVRLTG